MSDDSKKGPDANGGPVAGELLARARRAREISIQEVAKDLHLDEPKVLALEQNRFDALGAPVFAKGYLRKYAELMGVSVDDVIADYYRLNRSVGAPPLVTKRARPLHEFSLGPWLAALVLVLIAALGGLWWFATGAAWFAERDTARTSAPLAGDDVQLPARDTEATTGDTTTMPVPAAEDRAEDQTVGEAAEPQDDVGETVASPGAPPEPVAGEGLQLRLAFSGDCWTEVTDASGRRLYFGLGAAGDEVNVAGEPPLNVLLGDSENVAVFVNGAAYPIPTSARRGETARLTLTAR